MSPVSDYPSTRLFINGEWQDSVDGETINVIDPATEEIIGTVAKAGKSDLDAALVAVERGFQVWRGTPTFQRSNIMRKAASRLRDRVDYIAAIMTREQGKPLREAKAEVLGAADTIDWFAEEARRTYGRIVPARATGVTQMVIRLPVGPVAAFTPWNFPINQIASPSCVASRHGWSSSTRPA